jgi:cell wall-associated NlpC family hydrolase
MAVGAGQLAAILRGIGAPVTKQNMARLSAWQRAEGGSASFNPFNTTQGAAGASDYNSVGVKSYASSQQGTKATVQTLLNGRYAGILRVLRQNQGNFAGAVGSSPWGTSGSLIASILGGPYNPTAPTPDKGTVQTSGGASQATHFDAALYTKQAAMMMLDDAAQRANGVQPTTDLFSQLEAARKAATTRVDVSTGTAMPTAGAGGGLGGRVAAIAAKQIGTPYVWGGESKAGFDCSGLVQYAYAKLGIKLPRTAAEQGTAGRPVSYKNLKPGDLLVENNGDHVVMYAGNGKVIQAPHTGTNVQSSPLSWFPSDQYYARRIVG